MKIVLLVVAIVLFVILAFVAFAGGNWDTSGHLFGLLGIGLAWFAASFLPIK